MPNGAPARILLAISDVFETEIFSEHELQFWGFDTEEEWEAWQDSVPRGSTSDDDQTKVPF
jgi:hypothetical protein